MKRKKKKENLKFKGRRGHTKFLQSTRKFVKVDRSIFVGIKFVKEMTNSIRIVDGSFGGSGRNGRSDERFGGVDALGDLINKLLSGETVRIEIASAMFDELLVNGLLKTTGEIDELLVSSMERCSVLERTDKSFDHTERIETGLFAAEMSVPHIGDGTVGSFEFTNDCAVFADASEHARKKSGRPMDLSDFVSQDISVIVVCTHAKTAVSPADDLHGSDIGEEMLKFAFELAP